MPWTSSSTIACVSPLGMIAPSPFRGPVPTVDSSVIHLPEFTEVRTHRSLYEIPGFNRGIKSV